MQWVHGKDQPLLSVVHTGHVLPGTGNPDSHSWTSTGVASERVEQTPGWVLLPEAQGSIFSDLFSRWAPSRVHGTQVRHLPGGGGFLPCWLPPRHGGHMAQPGSPKACVKCPGTQTWQNREESRLWGSPPWRSSRRWALEWSAAQRALGLPCNSAPQCSPFPGSLGLWGCPQLSQSVSGPKSLGSSVSGPGECRWNWFNPNTLPWDSPVSYMLAGHGEAQRPWHLTGQIHSMPTWQTQKRTAQSRWFQYENFKCVFTINLKGLEFLELQLQKTKFHKFYTLDSLVHFFCVLSPVNNFSGNFKRICPMDLYGKMTNKRLDRTVASLIGLIPRL